ncbi:hypothetical protein ACLKMH_17405 [Psychromonas sp. KJ10-10]|uniref:hypothetical protein n=1 Tax=Psychromonas sp. KJ10-10 TaxID=3391823 RepID=UPI0039B55CFA
MSIQLVENIILDAFKNEPFHTLHFINEDSPKVKLKGGSCSDKVLSVKKQLESQGYIVILHSSYINGQDCHRLLKIIINDDEYFADVGNGWPSIKLFPTFENTMYESYGIKFESRICSDHIKLFQTRNSVTRLSQIIPFVSKCEEEILKDIGCRFEQTYPFTGKLRFAQIVGEKFLFLRDTDLEIYSESGVEVKKVKLINKGKNILSEEFNFDLSSLSWPSKWN